MTSGSFLIQFQTGIEVITSRFPDHTVRLKMALSTDVIVRKGAVTFPPKCVVCGKTSENEEIRLRGNPVGFFGVIPWLFGATRKLQVPAHRECGAKLSKSIFIRNLSLIVGITIVLILAVSLGLSKWLAIGLAVAAIVAPIIWQVIRPLPFEFTHHSDHFKLMFLDPTYARETAELNDGELDDDEGANAATSNRDKLSN